MLKNAKNLENSEKKNRKTQFFFKTVLNLEKRGQAAECLTFSRTCTSYVSNTTGIRPYTPSDLISVARSYRLVQNEGGKSPFQL